MANAALRRLYNPKNRECHCAPDCWCKQTTLGRVFRWWFPARLFGMRHKGRNMAEWKSEQE